MYWTSESSNFRLTSLIYWLNEHMDLFFILTFLVSIHSISFSISLLYQEYSKHSPFLIKKTIRNVTSNISHPCITLCGIHIYSICCCVAIKTKWEISTWSQDPANYWQPPHARETTTPHPSIPCKTVWTYNVLKARTGHNHCDFLPWNCWTIPQDPWHYFC